MLKDLNREEMCCMGRKLSFIKTIKELVDAKVIDYKKIDKKLCIEYEGMSDVINFMYMNSNAINGMSFCEDISTYDYAEFEDSIDKEKFEEYVKSLNAIIKKYIKYEDIIYMEEDFIGEGMMLAILLEFNPLHFNKYYTLGKKRINELYKIAREYVFISNYFWEMPGIYIDGFFEIGEDGFLIRMSTSDNYIKVLEIIAKIYKHIYSVLIEEKILEKNPYSEVLN